MNTLQLELPFVAASQSQKHVTVNEAFVRLDAAMNIAVKSMNVGAPPLEVKNGDQFVINQAPTGEWSGRAGQIASRVIGAWLYFTPKPGWMLLDLETDRVMMMNSKGIWKTVMSVAE